MNVLFINSVCGIRSTGRIVTDLADVYIEQGHSVKVAYGRGEVPKKYESIAYRIGTRFRVIKNALKARIFDNEAFNAKKETEKFLEWANNYNPDVLWLHNLHGYYINIELLFEWIKSRPNMLVKWTLHDCWAFTGHCSHFSYIGCDQWKKGCKQCKQKNEYPKSWMYDNCQSNYFFKKTLFSGVKNLNIIVPSFWLAEKLKESFLKEYPVEVIHNTIDINVFKPTKTNLREHLGIEEKFVILGVASAWNEKKGLNDFVSIANKLDNRYAVILVGLSERQIKQIPKGIIGIGRTNSKEELAEYYSCADVFLNLTYEDTYPTVNLEAQACGTPCFTFNTGGCAETIKNGCVIEQGNLEEVERRIKLLHKKGNI